MNVVKGIWYCYSCNAHGKLEDHVPTVEDSLSILSGETKPLVYPEEWLSIYDADHTSPYWAQRVGFDVASANRCGTDVMTGGPTYPIRNEHQQPVGVVVRGDNPKYKYPYGVSTSRTLFGRLKQCDVMVLLEGAGDVMAVQQAGLPEGWVAAGCYGAGLHYPQVGVVAAHNPSIVIVAFDDDDAGNGAKQRAIASLDDVCLTLSHPWSILGVKDPGEAKTEQIIPSLITTLQSNVRK